MVSKSNEAGEITKKANSDLDDAVGLGNKSSYAKMRAKAVAASDGYAKATILFEEADKLDPTAELAKAATYARKRKQQSDIVIRMAEAGKAGRFSAYNSDIKKQAALGKAAMAAGLPAILYRPQLGADQACRPRKEHHGGRREEPILSARRHLRSSATRSSPCGASEHSASSLRAS